MNSPAAAAARTLKRGKPGWRSRSVSAVGYAAVPFPGECAHFFLNTESKIAFRSQMLQIPFSFRSTILLEYVQLEHFVHFEHPFHAREFWLDCRKHDVP